MARARSKKIMGIPDEFWIAFVIMVGFFLKIVYVTKIGWHSGTVNLGAWQEVSSNTAGGGHISLIYYYYSHLKLPDFDCRALTCFTNPPLFYWIGALVMGLFCGVTEWSTGTALACLQCLNVLFVMTGLLAVISIVLKLGASGRKRVTAVICLMFFPTFYNMSGALDGSALSFMFMTLTLNAALEWYDTRRFKNLHAASIFFGFGMMTSYTCAMVLPPILYLIGKAAADGRRNDMSIRVQIGICFLTSSILGLWWPLYLLIRFGIPLFHVSPPFGMTIRESFGSRIAWPGRDVLDHLHTEGNQVLETNLWGQLIKTAVLDYQALDLSAEAVVTIVKLVIRILIAFCAVQHLMLFVTLVRRRTDHVHSVFIIVGEVSILLGYIIFCFRYPYVGTMNFRTISPILIYPLIGMSLCGDENSDSQIERSLSVLSGVIVVILSVLTAFLYGYNY